MNANRKRWGWGLGLLTAVALVWLAPAPESESPVLPPASASGQRLTSATSEPPSLLILRIAARDGASEEETESTLFGIAAVQPLPEAEPVVRPPVAPASQPKSAPPLPFILLGRYDDHQRSAVFLQYGGENLAVQAGDKIGSEYRVESLQGSSMVLRYLPGNVLQTMEVGGAR